MTSVTSKKRREILNGRSIKTYFLGLSIVNLPLDLLHDYTASISVHFAQQSFGKFKVNHTTTDTQNKSLPVSIKDNLI